jgi:hypothetical protein
MSFPFRVSWENCQLYPYTGTIPLHRSNLFRGAPCDCRLGSGDGCRMWFVNAWHWDGLVICNECQGIAERETACIIKGSMWIQLSTMLGVCSHLLVISCVKSNWFLWECLGKNKFGPKRRLCSVSDVPLLSPARGQTWKRCYAPASERGRATWRCMRPRPFTKISLQ